MKVDYASGSNVIALEPRRMDQVYPAVNEVEAYWSALAAREGTVPGRAEVDPRGIEGALPNAFILERLAPTVARFRLAGMHLNDLMGMEIRGMPLTAMFLPESRAGAGAALDRAFSTPARVTLVMAGDQGVGRGPLAAKMVLLPLADEAGRITRLMGALQAKGEIGRPPRRFAILETRIEAVPGDYTAAETSAPQRQPGLAEPQQASFATEPKRPALRLIRDES
jgi:hypothetical protein